MGLCLLWLIPLKGADPATRAKGNYMYLLKTANMLFLNLNNIYYDICSKSKKSSVRELMLNKMHITRDDRTKRRQRTGS